MNYVALQTCSGRQRPKSLVIINAGNKVGSKVIMDEMEDLQTWLLLCQGDWLELLIGISVHRS